MQNKTIRKINKKPRILKACKLPIKPSIKEKQINYLPEYIKNWY